MKLSKEYSGDQDPIVYCPVCNFENNHPIGVIVEPISGTNRILIGSKGVTMEPSLAAKGQRGISIVLQFNCEQGHYWESRFLFHKGSTSVTTSEMDPIDTLDVGGVIWRD